MKSDRVPVADAVEMLGAPDARWLRRFLRRRERACGARLLINETPEAARPTYAVDMDEVGRHCPELISLEFRVARVLRSEALSSRAALVAVEARLEATEEQLTILTECVRQLRDGRR